MSIEAIEEDFPRLRAGEWRISSEIDERYNCIAFAVHDTRQFWDPDAWRLKGYFWPQGVPRDNRVTSWMRVFELHSFKTCPNGELESDYEKVAIYADETNTATHVARQLEDGTWTSKLGVYEDIEHKTLDGLESYAYGNIVIYMKRKPARSAWNEQANRQTQE